MSPPDQFTGQAANDYDALWRGAEGLIDRLDRQSRVANAEVDFALELAESLRQFCSASGVTIRTRTQDSVKLIAKSGVSVFQIDEFQSNESDRMIDQSVSDKKRLVVTRPLTPTSDIETQLDFDLPLMPQQDRIFTETTQALSDILLPIVLRSEIASLSTALQSISSDYRLVESFYTGATVNETYQSIAKSLASLTHTDRVSIVRPNRLEGRIGKLVATSVPSDIDPRAKQAQSLGLLVHDTEVRDRYVNQFNVQQLHVEEIANDRKQILAWIVFEQYEIRDTTASSTIDRFAPYQDITRRAVQEAVNRDLASPYSITNMAGRFTLRSLAKISALTGIIFLILCLIKVPMRLSVPGRVIAASQITKFSPANGFVMKVNVASGDQVTAGTQLLELHSPELELVAQRLSSELATTTTKIDALQSLKRDAASSQASAELMVLKTEADGMRRQLELVRQEQQTLIVQSSQDGIVEQWDAKETLAGRVVVIGQPLLQIIDPAAGWTIELDIPDAQIGFVIDQQNEQNEKQQLCSFRLLSSPTQVHHGQLDHIDRAAQLNDTGQSIVRATIPIDSDQADGFRRGASVIAKVDCGRRSAAFVLFRGLVQWWRVQGWI